MIGFDKVLILLSDFILFFSVVFIGLSVFALIGCIWILVTKLFGNIVGLAFLISLLLSLGCTLKEYK